VDGDVTSSSGEAGPDDAEEPVLVAPPPPVGRPTHPDEDLEPMLLLRLEVEGLRVDINATHGAVGGLYDEVAALRGDLSRLADTLLRDDTDPDYDTLAVVHEQIWEVRRRLDEVATAPSAPAAPASDLGRVGTKRLGKELARRLNPVRPAFWRRARRAVR
jgi:hypothetical protein